MSACNRELQLEDVAFKYSFVTSQGTLELGYVCTYVGHTLSGVLQVFNNSHNIAFIHSKV